MADMWQRDATAAQQAISNYTLLNGAQAALFSGAEHLAERQKKKPIQ
jgi:hypothetical protein